MSNELRSILNKIDAAIEAESLAREYDSEYDMSSDEKAYERGLVELSLALFPEARR